jgi:hypothetical protein
MSAQLLEKLQAPPDEPKFNSLTPEKLAELEAAFHQQENIKALRNAGVVVGSGVVLGFAVLGADGAYAAPGGGAASNAAANAKATIEAGVTNAIDMIRAIDGIGLAAFGVALAPMGFMTTLRVLNMVLSRV